MKKIEAIIVDGVVYDVVEHNGDHPCHKCAFKDDPYCIFTHCCICEPCEIFKRRETKNEHE